MDTIIKKFTADNYTSIDVYQDNDGYYITYLGKSNPINHFVTGSSDNVKYWKTMMGVDKYLLANFKGLKSND